MRSPRFSELRAESMTSSSRFARAYALYWTDRFRAHFKVENPVRIQFGYLACPADPSTLAITYRHPREWLIRLTLTTDLEELGNTLAEEFAHIMDWPTSLRSGEDHGDGLAIWEREIQEWWKAADGIDRDILIRREK